MDTPMKSETHTTTPDRKGRSNLITILVVMCALVLGGAGGAYAYGKIGTKQLKNGAVTSAKIKNKTVKVADLNPSARGAKQMEYVTGSHNFLADPDLTVTLPGKWSSQAVANSSWSVRAVYFRGATGRDLVVEEVDGTLYDVCLPAGGRHAQVRINDPNFYLGTVYQIRIYRTTSTKVTTNVPTG